MEDKMQQARHIYFTQGKTQREIAAMVGVSERTIYNWMKHHAWQRLKEAAYHAPATIADNMCNQLVELQNTVAAREPGNRYPTPQEAETMRKLITGIEKMKKYPSLAQNMQMFETFKDYVRPKNKQFLRDLNLYSSIFIEAAAKQGFVPYQMEYGVDHIAPLDPFADELPEEQPLETSDTYPQDPDFSLLPEITA